jgi:putative restriction endonuclease
VRRERRKLETHGMQRFALHTAREMYVTNVLRYPVTTFCLTFKPHHPKKAPLGWPLKDLQNLIARFEVDPTAATEWWRFAAFRKAKLGDRILLFKQGDDPRGIFGTGTIVDGPSHMLTATDKKPKWRMLVRFDRLVDPTTRYLIPLKGNEQLFPKTLVDAQASGTTVPDNIADKILDRLTALTP